MDLLNHEQGFFVWEVIIFLIFLVLLKRITRKSLLTYLKERQAGISQSLASAERVKAEIEQLKKDNEALMAKAQEERATFLKEAKESSEKIISEADEEAKVHYERIMADVYPYIQELRNDAVKEIKDKAGSFVLEIAEKVLRKELSDTVEQENYIKRVIEKSELKLFKT